MYPGTEGLPPRVALLQLITASWVSHAVRTMAVLGVADHLADGPRTVGELAEATGTDAPTLARFMRALAALGLVAHDAAGRVGLTPLGEPLRAAVPGSLRSYALAIAAPSVERAWHDLPNALRTGEPSFPDVHGLGFWDYLAAHPEEGALFDAAMTGSAELRSGVLPAAVDLSAIGTLIDVGGGQGRMLAAALASAPGLRGVLADRSEVLPGAEAFLDAAGVRDRCDLVAVDFFESVPTGGDAYVLAHIVHDWPDEQAVAILRTCHQAMAPGARLWVVEQVIQPGDEYDRAKLLDMLMLVLFGAQERTADEYRSLLQAAGFGEVVIHPTDTPYSVIETVRH
ncbi:MAG: hypothetical protein AVDCRST_MAG87-487 [uncultured Thermomicrobiales bacterium]|uniref:O-methyltransferase domain-containing protein n=1 Tax=uncultured Thermomicrobiales bacterium TaxID=1645740 RepID=A0A6J4UFV7_9BACT|nr:MAG: hypothetical protein AVDCRST_MAG87-487 [uncultured Thermomicrobiales bacterium]